MGFAAAMIVLAGLGAVWVTTRDDDQRSDALLRFAPPVLTNPITVQVHPGSAGLRLEPGQDYVVEMPSEPLDVPNGLRISGGANVVLIGGEIRPSRWYPGDPGRANRALYLANQTGTVHIEGLRLGGALGEGINLSQPLGATVQLQNIVVEQVAGSRGGNHADIIQTWAGPDQLLVDGLSGHTTYQGFFLLPDQHHDGPAPSRFAFTNVELVADADAGYLFWLDAPSTFTVDVEGVWATTGDDSDPDRERLWWSGAPDQDPWIQVERGPAPHDVLDGARPGLGYVSPGYRSD